MKCRRLWRIKDDGSSAWLFLTHEEVPGFMHHQSLGGLLVLTQHDYTVYHERFLEKLFVVFKRF